MPKSKLVTMRLVPWILTPPPPPPPLRSPIKMNAVAESGKECRRLFIKGGYNALIFDISLYTQDDIVTDFAPDNPDIQFREGSTNNEVRIWGATSGSK